MFAHRRPRGELAALSVAVALWQLAERLPYKPPVTLLAAAAQVYIFFTSPLSAARACLSPAREAVRGLLRASSLERALTSAVHHADETHLYYNMASFIVKGADLEHRYGSAAFAGLLLALSVATQVAYIGLALAFGSKECGVGFSGVIFALKALSNAETTGTTNVGGLHVPTAAAAWAEIVLIAIISPRSSFLGHLAGVLVGTAAAWLLRVTGGRADSSLLHVLRSVFGLGVSGGGGGGSAGGGTAGGRGGSSGRWVCPRCARPNEVTAAVCATCGERRKGTWGRGTTR